MSSTALPYPPADLAARVGPGVGEDPIEKYEREGGLVRGRIEAVLPDGWDWTGKRVLDFGCGSARVLRHFLPEATAGAEFWGCDLDAPSIAWIQKNLSPPLHAFTNAMSPPLALDRGSFDLIWATSVFTHIEAWSGWLLELHAVLADDGLLIATFLGEGMWEALVGEPYDEDRIGMTVRRHWVDGGPGAEVFHSKWWLKEHWGRVFEIVEIADPPRNPDGTAPETHSYIVLRKRPGTFTSADVEALRPEEPRELAALETTVRVLRRELEEVATGQTLAAVARSAARDALLASPLAEPARAFGRAIRRHR